MISCKDNLLNIDWKYSFLEDNIININYLLLKVKIPASWLYSVAVITSDSEHRLESSGDPGSIPGTTSFSFFAGYMKTISPHISNGYVFLSF
jgi:hypothetical protein